MFYGRWCRVASLSFLSAWFSLDHACPLATQADSFRTKIGVDTQSHPSTTTRPVVWTAPSKGLPPNDSHRTQLFKRQTSLRHLKDSASHSEGLHLDDLCRVRNPDLPQLPKADKIRLWIDAIRAVSHERRYPIGLGEFTPHMPLTKLSVKHRQYYDTIERQARDFSQLGMSASTFEVDHDISLSLGAMKHLVRLNEYIEEETRDSHGSSQRTRTSPRSKVEGTARSHKSGNQLLDHGHQLTRANLARHNIRLSRSTPRHIKNWLQSTRKSLSPKNPPLAPSKNHQLISLPSQRTPGPQPARPRLRRFGQGVHRLLQNIKHAPLNVKERFSAMREESKADPDRTRG